MFHHFFYYGLNGGSPPTTFPFRFGDYTIEGSYSHRMVDLAAEQDYLFDSAAETALAASDFVMVYTHGTVTTTDNPSTNVVSTRFDCQGDGGSGSLLTTGKHTTTPGAAIWLSSYHNADLMVDEDYADWQQPIIVPSSVFSTGNSTRTGRINTGSAGTNDIVTTWIFCSWTANTDTTKRPGNFTVDGQYILSNASAVESNFLFPNGMETAISNSDFMIVSGLVSGGNNSSVPFYFDYQGDGGSGTMLTSGNGTTTAGTVVWNPNMGQRVYYQPSSIIGTANSTRTGRVIGNANPLFVTWTACSYV